MTVDMSFAVLKQRPQKNAHLIDLYGRTPLDYESFLDQD